MKPARRKARPVLLVLLWVWGLCMLLVVDLFLNVPELDGVRPRAPLYRAARRRAHEIVGEALKVPGRPPLPQATGLRTQRVAVLYPDGRCVKREFYRSEDGVLVDHGALVVHDAEGRKIGEGRYRQGLRHGRWVWYWPDGGVRDERHYRSGLLHGSVRRWYENGATEALEQYAAAMPHGVWRRWHADGVEAAAEEYRDGRLHGRAKACDESSRCIAEAICRDDLLDGSVHVLVVEGDPCDVE